MCYGRNEVRLMGSSKSVFKRENAAMSKRVFTVPYCIVVGAIFTTGCGSGVGNTGTAMGTRFPTCYAIGFSNGDIADIYDSALYDQAVGFSYAEESRNAVDACTNACYYEATCSNGCSNCALEIVYAAYSKQIEPTTKVSSTNQESALVVFFANN